MLVICDIDGTIANNDHRAHHVEKADGSKPTQEDWDRFLAPELVALDTPVPRALEVLADLIDHHQAYVVFLTGRSHELQGTTHEWLVKHFEPLMPRAALITRSPEDRFVKPAIYKEKVLRRLLADPRFQDMGVVAIDDDKYMWPVYRSLRMMTLKAPHCWDVLYPSDGELPEETTWRR